jgi:hypothetical protein
MMESGSLCVRDEKLNAFVDLESVIRAASGWLQRLVGRFAVSSLR